jgi:acetolactate synthase-1/2/3 large subunit
MREAFAVAATGRPGPVLIDFLKNVTAPNVLIDYEPMERKEHIRHGRLQQLTRRIGWDIKTPEPNHDDVRKLAEMISEAEKPLLICGGGVVRGRAHEKFRALAERIDAPVAITVMGAGGFPGGHPLTTGMIGMHGSQASNIACDNCDLLIAVGCRFSDRVALDPESFASQAKIVQIDIDRAEIDKNVKTDHHIIGDANRVLELLNEIVSEKQNQRWKDFVFSYKTRTEYEDKPGELTPQQVLETIRNHVPGDSIVATDVGQHQMWTIQHFHFDYPGQLLTSGLRPGCCPGCQAGQPGQDRPPYHRRRLLPHERPGACHREPL